MEPTALQIAWFLLFGVLIAGYAVLDGFDLGVGTLSLLRGSSRERRIMINAIGPVWDGNEVWLLTAGGALFAAFPIVYATVFSAFYLAFMLLLLFLIARAVSMEFRSKVESPAWRRTWDLAFGLGSLVPALLYGVAVGNIVRGIPLDADGTFTGTFLGLLNPYALVMGVLSLIMFTCHGALYMTLKSEGELRQAMVRWAGRTWALWVVAFLGASAFTFVEAPAAFRNSLASPLQWVAIAGLVAALVGVRVFLSRGAEGKAFLSSSVAVIAMVGLVGLALYPRLVPSLTDLGHSLTIANASSTPLTLKTMLVIALVGMPVVIAYTAVIYRVFKGKVVIGEDSY